ncbi:MAG: tyrosine-type recombinase/integrase, partial [Selenomonas sp.]|nr:tyrosine-type recombinase/integrase [Selenomonas sp.]
HTLRHTYATNLARAGVNQAIAMYLMGHTDISTTVEVYTDVQKDMAAKGDVQLRAWLSGKSVAETASQRSEYDELRNMASEIVRVTKRARDDIQKHGAVRAEHARKLAELGISFDEL